MNIPTELKYTKDHEWVRIEGDEAVTDFVESSIIKELKIEDISQCHSKNYQSRAPPKN